MSFFFPQRTANTPPVWLAVVLCASYSEAFSSLNKMQSLQLEKNPKQLVIYNLHQQHFCTFYNGCVIACEILVQCLFIYISIHHKYVCWARRTMVWYLGKCHYTRNGPVLLLDNVSTYKLVYSNQCLCDCFWFILHPLTDVWLFKSCCGIALWKLSSKVNT